MDKNKFKAFAKKYYILEAAIFAAVILFDLISKTIAKAALGNGGSVSILGSVLEFNYIANYGASYGMFAGMKNKNILFFVTTIVGLGIFGAMFYFFRKKKPLLRIGVVLMTAGALGNAIDRMFMPDKTGGHAFFSGGVRDFISINLGIPPFQFICNVADIALSAGVVIFALMYIFFDKEKKEEKPSDMQKKPETQEPEAQEK